MGHENSLSNSSDSLSQILDMSELPISNKKSKSGVLTRSGSKNIGIIEEEKLPSKMNIANFIDLSSLPTINTSSSNSSSSKKQDMQCPVCNTLIPNMDEIGMDKHIEDCLSSGLLEEEQSFMKKKQDEERASELAIGFGQFNDSVQPVVVPPTPKQVIPIPNFAPTLEESRFNQMNDSRSSYHDDDDEENSDQDEEEAEEESIARCPTCGSEMPYGYCQNCMRKNAKKPKVAKFAKPKVVLNPLNPYANNMYIPPSGLACPYGSCRQTIQYSEFVTHVLSNHTTEQYHLFACPICVAYTQQAYHVNKNTNLLQHIINTHAAGTNDPYVQTLTSRQSTARAPEVVPVVEKELETPMEFVNEQLTKSLEQECSICFEQFVEGQYISRLVCLCIYHRDCLSSWFQKQKRCPLHEMKEEVTKT